MAQRLDAAALEAEENRLVAAVVMWQGGMSISMSGLVSTHFLINAAQVKLMFILDSYKIYAIKPDEGNVSVD